jgi:multidrug efflux system outer membrane protein
MPILDFGRTSARVDQARALNQQSLISWQNALQVAYKDVRDALVNLREDSEAERAQASRVANARHTLGLAHLRLQAGHASLLDVLDSQRTFNDAQLAYITTRQAQLNASVELFKALGGGWKPATGS